VGCIAALGGYGTAAAVVGLIYIVGMLVVPFCPETRGRQLPENPMDTAEAARVAWVR
jgi:hypothetical protein